MASQRLDNIIPFPGNPRQGRVLQLRVELLLLSRPVWRVIQVPEHYSFWDLHVAIQDAMGWEDRHLHGFTVDHPIDGRRYRFGIPDDSPFTASGSMAPGWEWKIVEFFLPDHAPALYSYDFGDDWQHELTLESILDRDPDKIYPICIDGAGACPLEDCGGPPGYEQLVEALTDPGNRQHAETIEWAQQYCDVKDFDPARFVSENVVFCDPAQRWHDTFEDD